MMNLCLSSDHQHYRDSRIDSIDLIQTVGSLCGIVVVAVAVFANQADVLCKCDRYLEAAARRRREEEWTAATNNSATTHATAS